MLWINVVAVVLSAVLTNYLGLIEAVEKVIHHKLPILNCPRCLTFWLTLCLLLCHFSLRHLPIIVATSLLCAYLSEWVELCFGIFDKFYENIYNKTYPAEEAAETDSSTTDTETTETDMPQMRELME